MNITGGHFLSNSVTSSWRGYELGRLVTNHLYNNWNYCSIWSGFSLGWCRIWSAVWLTAPRVFQTSRRDAWRKHPTCLQCTAATRIKGYVCYLGLPANNRYYPPHIYEYRSSTFWYWPEFLLLSWMFINYKYNFSRPATTSCWYIRH